ncbi:RNA polymerase subunit sigma-70 [Enterococcus faecium]|uniref:RNA polymerase sigma factor 70 region 4 type 2 domain-containing protein n=2 Tax=Enterococcus TaxID=1350 RepID=A0A367CF83_9ENTE|nr:MULTISPECIES: sigma factor-like helix-turn-helix DNA-binding protein [Lactobacillales]MDU4625344.1 sigma factor-like helix-turn-helix DNA-binding protein [Enterococcus gallinarum]MDU4931964.1 sigma factor-like helix-turn-helix DNA-binding protein [Enterococcus gallinarum]PCE01331.1 RNA polymerase subunit sigma-70 [Enterococcus faecium]PQB68296.1 RNA polymerase subunit sigma-70 [Enterococcus faecium]PQB80272.1 RNA polymerase subunit sigma-70 [Enterococcus faecium]
MNPLDFRIVQMFDSFCKTVIRNEARNIKKQNARFREYQMPLNELSESASISFQVIDTSIDNSEVFLTFGMELVVENLDMAEAINQLDETKRIIILLYYFGGFNDREIGEAVGMSIGGIWYQRKKAEDELKKRMESQLYV